MEDGLPLLRPRKADPDLASGDDTTRKPSSAEGRPCRALWPRHAAVAALASLFALSGCKATPPGRVESAVAQWTKHHITVGGRRDRNPVADTPGNRADGQDAFVSYCSTCHGNDGQNTGVPFAQLMSPQVPELTDRTVQSYTDGQLRWIIANGLYPSGMPASKDLFSDDDIWRMVLYVRHLPPKGSLGDPKAFGGK